MMENTVTLYMAVTRDQYELPYAVAESVPELAAAVGRSTATIHTCLTKGLGGYVRVEVPVDEQLKSSAKLCARCGAALELPVHGARKYCRPCAIIVQEEKRKRKRITKQQEEECNEQKK